jgi:hypothetical protein
MGAGNAGNAAFGPRSVELVDDHDVDRRCGLITETWRHADDPGHLLQLRATVGAPARARGGASASHSPSR